jgi:hypothetical protein
MYLRKSVESTAKKGEERQSKGSVLFPALHAVLCGFFVPTKYQRQHTNSRKQQPNEHKNKQETLSRKGATLLQ